MLGVNAFGRKTAGLVSRRSGWPVLGLTFYRPAVSGGGAHLGAKQSGLTTRITDAAVGLKRGPWICVKIRMRKVMNKKELNEACRHAFYFLMNTDVADYKSAMMEDKNLLWDQWLPNTVTLAADTKKVLHRKVATSGVALYKAHVPVYSSGQADHISHLRPRVFGVNSKGISFEMPYRPGSMSGSEDGPCLDEEATAKWYQSLGGTVEC